MKKLHLIRHAKSSWSDGSLADKDRPLNKRGLKSCRIMAPEIVKVGCCFDHVFCSPAVRAQLTIEHICQSLTEREIKWQLDDALYTFDTQVLWEWCRGLDNAMSDVMIIGHNPAMTDFCNEVSNCNIENIPTCGYVQLGFARSSWQDLSSGSCELLSFLKPKMFI